MAETGDKVQQGVQEGGSSHCQGGSWSDEGGITHCWEHGLLMTELSLGNLDHRFPIMSVVCCQQKLCENSIPLLIVVTRDVGPVAGSKTVNM